VSGLFASLTATASRAPGSPAGRRGPQRLISEFPTYAGAEELIDRLSDKGFPVEHTRIVGTDLRSVEYVTGRLTSRDAAAAGAVSGAWLGLFVGLLVGMFNSSSAWFGVLVSSTLMGAVWLGVFGFLAHRMTRGRRDFASVRNLEAGHYAVHVDEEHVDAALRLGGLL
jgi:heat induced stress protein YflT